MKALGRRLSVSRASVMTLSALAVTAAAYAGCSSDEETNPTVTPGNGTDGGSDVAQGSDTSTKTDGTTTTPDTGTPDSAPACADPVFDCTKNAGNTDAGGSGATSTAAQQVPTDIRCTGLYACFATKTVAATHKNYVPAYKLYSDGSEKQRWMLLPAGTKIDTGGGGPGTPDEWIFPVGTMVYKEFQLNGKRIETRRTWKAGPSEWIFSVWRWADDESTATLMNDGTVIANPAKPGTTYEVPSNSACAPCHTGHVDKFLSLDAWSLGGAGATGLTLASLKADNLLTSWDHPTSLAVAEDTTGKFNGAMGFYYNNCGFCHKPGGQAAGTGLHLNLPVAEAFIDGGAGLNAADTPIYKTAVGVAHTNQAPQGNSYPAASGFKRIVPADPDKSVVLLRDSLRNPDGGSAAPGQMPPSIMRTTDDAGLAATRAWIQALP